MSLSRHPHVLQFLKGATSISPPQHHRFPTWKLNVVLNTLTGPPFEPIMDIPLKILRMKAIFLVAITSARRVSEIGALSSDPKFCRFHQDNPHTGPSLPAQSGDTFSCTARVVSAILLPQTEASHGAQMAYAGRAEGP